MVFSLVKKVAKGTVKTVGNIPAWFGYEYLKENTRSVVSMIRPIYKTKTIPANQRMTFDEVSKRYQLSDYDLHLRLKNLQWQSWLYGILAALSFCYLLYLLIGLHIMATILAAGVTLYLLVKLCICRFWIYQIKQRKLGCSLQEWLRNGKSEG